LSLLTLLRSELCQWLWSKLLREQLDEFTGFRNGFRSRKDSKKFGPSGTSRDDVFAQPTKFGLKNALLELDEEQLKIVEEIKQAMGGDSLFDFVSKDYSEAAEEAYVALGVQELTFENVWHVFESLLSLL